VTIDHDGLADLHEIMHHAFSKCPRPHCGGQGIKEYSHVRCDRCGPSRINSGVSAGAG
jgi:hypothetical protein